MIAMSNEAAEKLFRQGNLLHGERDLEGAAECYRQALEIDPGFAAASFNLGCTLDLLSGPGEALPYFLNAATLRPNWCDAHRNLGFALARVGRMPEAAERLKAAAALNPADAGIRNNLALALAALGEGEEAYAAFREAIRLDPLYAEPHNNLGVLLERHGSTSAAITSCLQAIKLRRDYPEAHNNLASALKSQGRHAEAIAQYREALRLKPDYAEAESSLLFTLCYPAGVPEKEVVAEHLKFGSAHRFPAAPHHNDPSLERVIKVGYVSADFRSHAVARFIEPVLRHHDRSRFRVFCYSNVSVPDDKSAALKGLADHFTDIAGISDQAAEATIRRDGIDILVDLSGHTADNRLLLFARKPAPVQITWLGYPHTTGLDAIDYRITDAITDPPGSSEASYAEALLRLPAPFSCFAPPEEAPEVAGAPPLSTGVVTFGSFNNPAKITEETVALWSAVLRKVPASRMLVKGYSLADGGSRNRLTQLFAAEGIQAERLELHGNTPSYRDHLALYNRLDIALDTFPYNGTTTTCEALWMGVPVVTLAGSTHRSRVGASILSSVGLEELVALDSEGYCETAVKWARDGARLATLRETMRQRMANSPLTDGIAFTRSLEEAYREVWGRWCAGKGKAPLSPLGQPAPPPLQQEGSGGDGYPPSSDGSPHSRHGFITAEDGTLLGRKFLQQGRLDRALQAFLGVLGVEGIASPALGGIEETLNRQTAADLAAAVTRDARTAAAPPAAGKSGGWLPEVADVEEISNQTLEECARLLLASGFFTPADLLCRYLQDRGYRHPSVSRTMGEVALSIGAAETAALHFREAIAMGDGSTAARIELLKAEESARLSPASVKRERYLLIKAWGYGFWSDVGHVLGQLLVAEITGRIPVVHWGGNSLFSDDPYGNAFESFFEPVSRFTLEDLRVASRSFYPPKWNPSNLAEPRLNQADGPWSRCSSLHALERPEEVVVSDFHYAVNDLAGWIPVGHRLHGLGTDDIFLDLCQRYLKVKPWIAAKAELFYRQRLTGRSYLAVHVRGGDKGGEDANLGRLNALYHAEIERFLQQAPQGGLFLMTDDREILASYQSLYRDRVVTTGATRTASGEGVHYQQHPSRYRLGEEVLVDTLLALRCDAFIGNGLSNVSCAVAQLKGWRPGTIKLLGARLDRLRQMTLYRS